MISIKIRINAFILDLFSSEILSGSVTVNCKGLLFSVIFYNVDRLLSCSQLSFIVPGNEIELRIRRGQGNVCSIDY